MHGPLLIRRASGVFVLAAVLVALVVIVGPALCVSPGGLYVMGPAGAARLGNLCWLYDCTGIPCPMCGMLRSLVALLHGDVTTSVLFHPAGPVMGAALVGAAVAFCWRARGGVLRWLHVGAAVAIVTGVVRWMM
jgi:hypothetical protein